MKHFHTWLEAKKQVNLDLLNRTPEELDEIADMFKAKRYKYLHPLFRNEDNQHFSELICRLFAKMKRDDSPATVSLCKYDIKNYMKSIPEELWKVLGIE